MQNGDVNAALRVLEGAARTDEKLYWRYEVGEGQHMCDLFWSDGRSQDDYKVFGDVLAFDATYGRNKYNLPVAEFEMLWDAMVEECGVRELEWVKDVYEKKSSWATAYIRDRFYAGLRTTSRCESLHAKLGRFVESRYGILEFVTNFQRCVDFLRDNEEELDFRSSYGTPVLQTQFPELEKSGAINFTREIFSRYRESLKRCVRVTILECIEREDRCVYVTQKYRRPNSRWDVVHMKRKEEFLCSCLRMESFGLPCVHILAVLVRLDIDSLPKSLVLARWSKAAKEDLCYEPLSSRYSDAGVLYRSRMGAFLQHCKRLAKVACIREEDFRQYLAKEVQLLGMELATVGEGLGILLVSGRKAQDVVMNLLGLGVSSGVSAAHAVVLVIEGPAVPMLHRHQHPQPRARVQTCYHKLLTWVRKGISNVLDILESSFKGTVSAQVHDLHNLQESVLKTKQEACSVLPEISGAASHPKITEVLLERNSTDTALMILRWAGGVGVPHNISLRDAVTAVRARIECGLLTEAFMHHRNLCTRVKEKSFNKGSPLETADVPKGQLSYWVEVLVTEICCLCIRRNLANGMLELP
ncbi:hypothetical protein Ahy_A01g000237 [Arachis hypogaea]|uniref:Protein FAR1-RELATED SEQUENCE n=1 Tax=Arachis hypogaea TaxID=3818 RepID=A0A445EJM6_ARAHY|nr:hypothetical protein Ahy_A01g000237 [Arachis hypogaea]